MAYGSTEITAGSGTPVATDVVSTVRFQRVKLVDGTEGSTGQIGHAEDAAHASGDAGIGALVVRKDTAASLCGTDGDYTFLEVDSSGRLHVNVGNTVTVGSHAVTNAGTFVVQIDGAALTSLQLLDDAVSGAGFNISQMNGVNVTMGNGASGTGVQRVTIANDSTGILAGVTTVGTVTTVSSVTAIANALPAGNNNIGDVDVASIAAGDNNIGNVDIVTVPTDPFGANADAASATGSISAKLRFIAATGIPITGTVTVGSHAVTNAGTFAVQAASAGDTAHDAADAGNPVKVGTKSTSGQSGATLVTANDRSDMVSDLDGAVIVRNVSLADVITQSVTDTAGTTAALSSFGAVSGKKNVITQITAFRTDAGTSMAFILMQDGSGGTTIFAVPIPPLGGVVIGNGSAALFKQPTANTGLFFDVSSALSTVYLTVTGYQTKL